MTLKKQRVLARGVSILNDGCFKCGNFGVMMKIFLPQVCRCPSATISQGTWVNCDLKSDKSSPVVDVDVSKTHEERSTVLSFRDLRSMWNDKPSCYCTKDYCPGLLKREALMG